MVQDGGRVVEFSWRLCVFELSWPRCGVQVFPKP